MPNRDEEEDYEGVIVCVLFGVILLGLLIFFSLSFVEPTNYGLVCNKITKNCDSTDVKEAGRYLVGPHKFILQFPRYQMSVSFIRDPLKSRTKEGLELSLSLSFQYQLVREGVPQLYYLNNMMYEQTFIRIARDTIMKSAGHYIANQYWEERSKIQQDMYRLLDDELRKAHARCTGLQLLIVDLPATYEKSIVETQVEQQKQKLKSFEQQAILIRKDIDILRSDNDQKVLTISSQAQADAYQIQQQAVAQEQMLSIDAETNVASTIKSDLGLNGQEMKKYLVYNELKNKMNATVVMGLDNIMLRGNK